MATKKQHHVQSMRLAEDTLYIFTDGSVEPNPGPGGWGVLLIWNGYRRAFCGGGKEETNNTMELQAILQGLSVITDDVPTKLFSDSQYCVNALTKWVEGWKKRGWMTREGEPVKNKKLIQVIHKNLNPNIQLHWVKGHAGNVFNEMADYLARRGRDIYGLGLTEYNGPIDLSPLNKAMAHLSKDGDPPFEPGEEDLPFPVEKWGDPEPAQTFSGTFQGGPETDGVPEEVVNGSAETVPAFNPEELLRELKETRGLVRRADEKLKALEKGLKELLK